MQYEKKFGNNIFVNLKDWVLNQSFIEPQKPAYNYLINTKEKWDKQGGHYKINDLNYSLLQFMVYQEQTSQRPYYFGLSEIYKMLAQIDEEEGRDGERFWSEAEKCSKMGQAQYQD